MHATSGQPRLRSRSSHRAQPTCAVWMPPKSRSPANSASSASTARVSARAASLSAWVGGGASAAVARWPSVVCAKAATCEWEWARWMDGYGAGRRRETSWLLSRPCPAPRPCTHLAAQPAPVKHGQSGLERRPQLLLLRLPVPLCCLRLGCLGCSWAQCCGTPAAGGAAAATLRLPPLPPACSALGPSIRLCRRMKPGWWGGCRARRTPAPGHRRCAAGGCRSAHGRRL